MNFRTEVVFLPTLSDAGPLVPEPRRQNHRYVVGCALPRSLSRPDVRRPSMRISYDSSLLCCLAGSPPHKAKPLASDDMREEEQKSLFSAGSISSSCFGARHRAVAKSLPANLAFPGLLSQSGARFSAASSATSILARHPSGVAALELAAGVPVIGTGRSLPMRHCATTTEHF